VIDNDVTTTLLNHGQTKTVQKLAEWGRAKKTCPASQTQESYAQNVSDEISQDRGALVVFTFSVAFGGIVLLG